MEEVKESDTQRDNITFFYQAWDRAIAQRLSLAQKEANNFSFLENEFPNLWQTVQQCHQRRDWKSIVAFQDVLRLFLERRGYMPHCLTLNIWACEAAKILGNAMTVVRFTHDQTDLLQRQRNYREAERLYQQCEEGYRVLGENEMALKSRHMRALTVRAEGRSREAKTLCESTIDEARNLGLDQWLAHPCYMLALLARDQKKFQEAKLFAKESLSRLTDETDVAMIAQCHRFLGSVTLLQGDWKQARVELERSFYLYQQVGGLHGLVSAGRLLGNLERAEGRYEHAKKRHDEALETASQLKDLYAVAALLTEQARLMIHVGKRYEALLLVRGAISTFHEIGIQKTIKLSLLLVWLYLCLRQWRQAFQTSQEICKALLSHVLFS